MLLDKITPDNFGTSVEKLLRELEKRFEINITVHDNLGLLRGKDGSRLLPGRQFHVNRYCFYGRRANNEWEHKCARHCHFETDRIFKTRSFPFINHCWKGVTEVVAPVYSENVYVGCLFAGAFRTENFRLKEKKLPAKLIELYDELPRLDQSTANILVSLLSVVGQGIFRLAENFMVTEEFPSRKGEIRKFIILNAERNLKIADLAKELSLSISRTSHLVQELYGISFRELVMQERINRAKTILESSDLPLAEVAEKCGFSNVYYFSNVFKDNVGQPPGKYRTANRVQFDGSEPV